MTVASKNDPSRRYRKAVIEKNIEGTSYIPCMYFIRIKGKMAKYVTAYNSAAKKLLRDAAGIPVRWGEI